LRTYVTELVTLGTLSVSIFTAVVSARTQGVVESSAHAQAVTTEFTQNVDKLTQSFTKHDREDEEAADITLTALEDFAQTADDQIAIVTIAARMLNPTACRSNGEATARFLTPLVARLKSERTDRSRAVLAFMRSQPFLDLAASDITIVYYNDDPIQEQDACSDPSPSPQPSRTGARPAEAAAPRATPTPAPTPTPRPGAAALRYAALLKLRRLRATPQNGAVANHATYWGEQTMWNDAKAELFRELRPDGYAGWIHIATWETADTCVDTRGRPRTIPHLECGDPIAVDYTSSGSPRIFGDTSIVNRPFWLGRARFLRNAAPRLYAHATDSTMTVRGSLGHVIGVVAEGECVVADALRYYHVSPIPDRSFVHVWAHVRASDEANCNG
jgi:hypothetical protein